MMIMVMVMIVMINTSLSYTISFITDHDDDEYCKDDFGGDGDDYNENYYIIVVTM